jgi:hypothetical protein
MFTASVGSTPAFRLGNRRTVFAFQRNFAFCQAVIENRIRFIGADIAQVC